jgi:hypothetical protein
MLRVSSALWLLFVANLVFCIPQPNIRVTEEDIIQVLEEYEVEASQKCRDYNLAAWNYNTDVENATKIEELVSKHRIPLLYHVQIFLSLYVVELV